MRFVLDVTEPLRCWREQACVKISKAIEIIVKLFTVVSNANGRKPRHGNGRLARACNLDSQISCLNRNLKGQWQLAPFGGLH